MVRTVRTGGAKCDGCCAASNGSLARGGGRGRATKVAADMQSAAAIMRSCGLDLPLSPSFLGEASLWRAPCSARLSARPTNETRVTPRREAALHFSHPRRARSGAAPAAPERCQRTRSRRRPAAWVLMSPLAPRWASHLYPSRHLASCRTPPLCQVASVSRLCACASRLVVRAWPVRSC